MINVDDLPEDWIDIIDKFLQSTDKLDITGWEIEHENYIPTDDLTELWKALMSLE